MSASNREDEADMMLCLQRARLYYSADFAVAIPILLDIGPVPGVCTLHNRRLELDSEHRANKVRDLGLIHHDFLASL